MHARAREGAEARAAHVVRAKSALHALLARKAGLSTYLSAHLRITHDWQPGHAAHDGAGLCKQGQEPSFHANGAKHTDPKSGVLDLLEGPKPPRYPRFYYANAREPEPSCIPTPRRLHPPTNTFDFEESMSMRRGVCGKLVLLSTLKLIWGGCITDLSPGLHTTHCDKLILRYNVPAECHAPASSCRRLWWPHAARCRAASGGDRGAARGADDLTRSRRPRGCVVPVPRPA